MSIKLIGKVLLNQFRVDAFVAAGGMGAVYRVWDQQRNVNLAMKILHAELAEDPSVFKRFKREATALKKLAHPSIVPFYGLFETPEFAFLLERFIEGPSLKEILKKQKKNRLTVEETLIYLKAICSALGYAHNNGIVHCDVKPGNVMVDSSGGIYLTDFGIARHAESTTTTLGVAGTAAYMAPEQIRAEPVTPATDVYALGVLLFEMLTGKRPFQMEGKATEESGLTQSEFIRNAQLQTPPPDPRTYREDIPETLAQVILKALGKEPKERYQTTLDLFSEACQAAGIQPGDVPNQVAPFDWYQAPRPSVSVPVASQPAVARGSALDQAMAWLSANTKMVIIGVGALAVLAIVGFVLLLFLLNSKPAAAVPGQGPTQESEPMEGEAMPADTPEPEATPTPAPTATPAPVSISMDNASSLTRVQVITSPKGFYSIDFSPDGKTIASAGLDGYVKIWDVETGEELASYGEGDKEMLSVAFSPDGNMLAASGSDYNVRLIDLKSGQETILEGHTFKVDCVAFSPDGSMLASSDGTVMLWDTQSKKLIENFSENPDEVVFTSDSKYLAISAVMHSRYIRNKPADWIPIVNLYDVHSKANVNTYDLGFSWVVDEHITTLAFSPDGNWVALGGPANSIYVGYTSDKSIEREYSGHTGEITHVVFSPDSTLLASSSTDLTVTIWDVDTGLPLKVLEDHTAPVRDVVFSPDGSMLASTSEDSKIIIYSIPR